MSIQAANTSVFTTAVVQAPIDRAFKVFTEGMPAWWPADHHILKAELAEMVFEPRVGGRIIDRGVDGSECSWSRVLVYEPPHRVVFSWDITAGWELETNPERASEVEVRFIAEAPDRTRVELEHRELQRHGDGWEGMRDAVASPGGWPAVWDGYTPALAA
jgi:uncharacterized protein YndB with AHSA1/START domain